MKAVVSIYKNTADPFAKGQEAIQKKRSAKEGKLEGAEKRIYGLLQDITGNVVDNVVKACQARETLQQTISRLNDARMACSGAKVWDMNLQKQRIEEQIQTVQTDLDFLTPLVTSVIAQSGSGDEGTPSTSLLTATDEVQDENFIDVIIKSDQSGSFISNSTASAPVKVAGI